MGMVQVLNLVPDKIELEILFPIEIAWSESSPHLSKWREFCSFSHRLAVL